MKLELQQQMRETAAAKYKELQDAWRRLLRRLAAAAGVCAHQPANGPTQ